MTAIDFNEAKTTVSDGIELAYKTAGNGPVGLVFMHGWGSTRNYFDETIKHLDLGRLTVVCFDLRGHGASQHTMEGQTVERLARDMLEVATAAGFERFVSAGHSMGAKYIQYLPVLAPERILGQLLIAGTPACAIPIDPALIETFADFAGNRDAFRQSHHDIITRPVPHAVSERWVREAAEIERGVLHATLKLCFDADIEEAVRRVRPFPPTFAVAGSGDPFFSPGMLREQMVDRLPGARIAVFDCGHEIPYELPETLAALTEAFVAGCTAEDARV